MTVFHRDSVTITIRYRHYPKRRKTNIFFHYKSTQNETLSIFLVFSWKKLFSKRLQVYKKQLPLHPQSENETYSERQRGSLKSSFEKIFRKIWKGCENELSLHHFPLWKSLKTFEVFFWKRFGKSEKRFYLCNRFPLRKMKQRRTRKVLTIKIERRSLKILSS